MPRMGKGRFAILPIAIKKAIFLAKIAFCRFLFFCLQILFQVVYAVQLFPSKAFSAKVAVSGGFLVNGLS